MRSIPLGTVLTTGLNQSCLFCQVNEGSAKEDSEEYVDEGTLEYEILSLKQKIESFEKAIQNCATSKYYGKCL